jgi:hypothetical protein
VGVVLELLRPCNTHIDNVFHQQSCHKSLLLGIHLEFGVRGGRTVQRIWRVWLTGL